MSLLVAKTKLFFLTLLLFFSVVPAHAKTPERIVSLVPSITESICQLGKAEALVAVTYYCDYPRSAPRKEVIGTLINPNIEKIYSLSPDLVLAMKDVNKPQTIEKLKSLGLKVVVFDECNNFGDIQKNFIRLGEMIGRSEEAKIIIKEAKAETDYLAQKMKHYPRPKVFYEIEAWPLVTANENAFINEFLKYGGGINIFADTSLKYPRVSREEVLKRNPDVIILVTMGNVSKREKRYWKKFKFLTAAKLNQIYVVDANKICRPTPGSFLESSKEIARLLHPEAFRE